MKPLRGYLYVQYADGAVEVISTADLNTLFSKAKSVIYEAGQGGEGAPMLRVARGLTGSFVLARDPLAPQKARLSLLKAPRDLHLTSGFLDSILRLFG